MTNTRFPAGLFTRLLLSSIFLCSAPMAVADNFSAFTAESFEEIKSSFEGREFLLGLWSVDCPPCMVELAFMAELVKLNPSIPYVLVSTDPINQRDYSAEFLEDIGMAEKESWIFADSFVERLRFSIDPNWYGELPRSYFFDSDHAMKSHSGIVSEELLIEWFEKTLHFR
ncbi:MAG: TlpA family protein disulfide reductase [Gammaproteobacteria bacterium]|nr:TlpA family protein disulfide reductase [Gammaproteobacteria bacterium]MBL4728290.1 TlpA family protein disulfide reductase [Gammaproteobacteria bacterium]